MNRFNKVDIPTIVIEHLQCKSAYFAAIHYFSVISFVENIEEKFPLKKLWKYNRSSKFEWQVLAECKKSWKILNGFKTTLSKIRQRSFEINAAGKKSSRHLVANSFSLRPDAEQSRVHSQVDVYERFFPSGPLWNFDKVKFTLQQR